MSVVFSLLRNNYSIIATDTRIMLDPLGSSYTDDYKKLYQSESGWVSGTGVGDLIRNMIDKLDQDADKTLFEEAMKLSSKYPLKHLQNTLISFSALDKTKRLNVFYMGSGCKLTSLQPNSLLGMQPADMNDVKWNEIYDKYSSKITIDVFDLDNDIKTIAEAIYEVSKNCSTVSKICDIGILTNDGETYCLRR